MIASLCLGALSLPLLPHAINYDAMSWLVWGRQLDHLALSTQGSGTSFKPLTVLIDAVLTLFGRAAPSLWLVVVRAGAVFAMALAFHLGRRFQGPLAGLIAVAGVFTAHQLVSYLTIEGTSEALAVACCLATVDLALRGRHRAAITWLAAASLLQIDLIGLLVVYALVFQVRLGRRHRVTAVVLVGTGVLMGLAWTLPDLISSGNILRSASLATRPTDGGPLLTSFPGWAVIKEMHTVLLVPIVIGWCGELVADAWWLLRRRVVRPLSAPAVAAAVFVLGQAAATQLHLTTGTPRFLLAGAGVVAVVGACFWVELARAAAIAAARHVIALELPLEPPWRSPRTLIAKLDPVTWLGLVGGLIIAVFLARYTAVNVKAEAHTLSSAVAGERALAAEQADLGRVVAGLGGRAAILACGPVYGGSGWQPLIAWTLDIPVDDELPIGQPAGNGTALYASAPPQNAGAAHYRTRRQLGSPEWWLLSTCTL